MFRLNEANFRSYVERVRGWDERAERQDMERLFDPEADKIIMINGRDAGVLGVDRCESEIHLRHIELLPEYQGRGIGTDVIRSLLHEARGRRTSVSLRVTKKNPARPLYERLGFRIAGETDNKYLMVACQDGF